MSKADFDRLIANQEIIEHPALKEQLETEFKNNIQQSIHHSKNASPIKNQSPAQLKKQFEYLSNIHSMFHPCQPPSIPTEQSLNTPFIRATHWPVLSVIQRASTMYFISDYKAYIVTEYLKSNGLSEQQISLAVQVSDLMNQSLRYWRKVIHLGKKYKKRFSKHTRKFALQRCPWSLQLAMTLKDFHLDHIVDIVFRNDVWSTDHDFYIDSKESEVEDEYDEDETFEEDLLLNMLNANLDDDEDEEEEKYNIDQYFFDSDVDFSCYLRNISADDGINDGIEDEIKFEENVNEIENNFNTEDTGKKDLEDLNNMFKELKNLFD